MSAQGTHAAEEAVQWLLWILQLLHMRKESAGLHRIHETGRRTFGPARKRRFLRETVKAVVDFNRVKPGRVMFEPACLRQLGGIEVAAPMFVFPSGASDARGRGLTPIPQLTGLQGLARTNLRWCAAPIRRNGSPGRHRTPQSARCRAGDW